MTNWITASLFGLTLALAGTAVAQPYQEGTHYFELDRSVPTSAPDKIEVVEVFRYSCPHCAELSPLATAWAESLPDDVVHLHCPTSAGYRQLEIHVRAYYAAKSVGKLDELHPKLFEAYKRETKLKNSRHMAEVFAEVGVDPDKFNAVFNSFGVNSQSKMAESRVRGYRAAVTPCLVVNGKYRITKKSAGGEREMFDVADYLIEQERLAAR